MNHWIVIKTTAYDETIEIPFEKDEYQQIQCGSVQAYYCRNDRFCNDQVYAAGDDGILISDGILLNLRELKDSCHTNSLIEVIQHLWQKKKARFFDSFIGPFSGAVYEQKTDLLTAYGNQTGDAPVFYYKNHSCFIVSNDFNLIERLMKANRFERTLDETAAKYLLTFAYMLDERTLFQEVKRLLPGEYLTFSNDTLSIAPYHHFSFQPLNISFSEAIELVDAGFRKAVERCFSKDEEYGCSAHLVDLSGGLDSRMTAWVAHDMGYQPSIYLNYCQFGSDELRCASRVADTLGGQLLYKQLDDASFLYEIDRLIDRNYGLSLCIGSTGNDQFLRILDRKQFGLEHTGQIGDAVLGTFGKEDTVLCEASWNSLKYSRLVPFTPPSELLEKFESYEEFSLYTRAFQGALASHMIRRHNMYIVAPFLDPDFIQLCESIPLAYRVNHKLYLAWIDAKYPLAGQLPSTHIRSGQKAFLLRCRNYAVRKGGKILRRAGFIKQGAVPNNMNPFDYWYETKPELRNYLETYYQETRPLLKGYPEIGQNVDLLHNSERTMDKLVALNLLAAVKRYFLD